MTAGMDNPLQLVIFDMDGVIFSGKNFWLDFHRAMGTERQAWELWHGLSKRDYVRLSERTAQIWTGQSVETLDKLVSERTLVPGIDEVFQFIRTNDLKSAIISSGPFQLARRAQDLFGIDLVQANRLDVDDSGHFSGIVEVEVDENDKASAAHRVFEALGIDSSRAAMIGDSSADAQIARLVGLAIAYDSNSDELNAACDYEIRRGEMKRAAKVLASSHAKRALV